MKNNDLFSIRDGVLEIARKMKLADEERRARMVALVATSTKGPGHLERSAKIMNATIEHVRKKELADEQRRARKADPAVRSTNDPGYMERSAEIIQATVRLFASRS